MDFGGYRTSLPSPRKPRGHWTRLNSNIQEMGHYSHPDQAGLVPANIVWSVGDSLGFRRARLVDVSHFVAEMSPARNQDTLAHAETLARMYLPRTNMARPRGMLGNSFSPAPRDICASPSPR